jgi:hypothetical protein
MLLPDNNPPAGPRRSRAPSALSRGEVMFPDHLPRGRKKVGNRSAAGLSPVKILMLTYD